MTALGLSAVNRARKQAGHNAFDNVKLWRAPERPACLRARFTALKPNAVILKT